jgi:very-short-patch-repair endonuclease
MPDIAALVDALGGMAQKQQLVARGARDIDLTLAVRRGSVDRARQGWYTTLPASDPRVRAVCVGGRLTGISAVIALGGWVLGRHPLHVSLHANAARLRTPWNRFVQIAGRIIRGLVLHWDDATVATRGDSMVVDLRDALRRVVLDEEFETAVAALDWALHTGQLDRIDFERMIRDLPQQLRHIADWVDEQCESLPESLARTRFRLLGHEVETQVRLGELERIDLVIDRCVGMETDGEEFHIARFERDRAKDIDITIADLHAIRPSARMVFHNWEKVVLAVESAVAARTRRRAAQGAVDPIGRPPPAAALWGRGWPRARSRCA